MPDADAGHRDPESGAGLSAGADGETWEAAIAKDLKGARLREEAGVADRGRASRCGPTTARRTWPGWTTSCARRRAVSVRARHGPGLGDRAGRRAGARSRSAPTCCTRPARTPCRNWATRIAAGVERLVELTASLPVDTAAPQIEFVFAVGSDYFVEIAKLRAARMLWAQAVSAFGPRDDGACRCGCTCARRGATRASTTATRTCCASRPKRCRAAVGGCDQLDGGAVRLRCAPGAERAAHSEGGVASGRGGGSGGRVLLHRGADGCAGARGAGSCSSRWRPRAATPRRWLPGSIDKALARDARGAGEGVFGAAPRAGGRQQLSRT